MHEPRTTHGGGLSPQRSRRLLAIGNPAKPHSFTYLPDLPAAMVRAAKREDLWNTVLHAPKVSGMPGGMLRAVGLVHPATRELAEMAYQFDSPFVMDSRRSESLPGRSPAPLADGARATVDRWRETHRD